jgi:hypothetical protein
LNVDFAVRPFFDDLETFHNASAKTNVFVGQIKPFIKYFFDIVVLVFVKIGEDS